MRVNYVRGKQIKVHSLSMPFPQALAWFTSIFMLIPVFTVVDNVMWAKNLCVPPVF